VSDCDSNQEGKGPLTLTQAELLQMLILPWLSRSRLSFYNDFNNAATHLSRGNARHSMWSNLSYGIKEYIFAGHFTSVSQ
ncbi:hypothetical protein AMECASPLE_034344, partial [Ameca splendens]